MKLNLNSTFLSSLNLSVVTLQTNCGNPNPICLKLVLVEVEPILTYNRFILFFFNMAQSNESKLRGLEFFWNNTLRENQHDWERWSEKFQLTIIAKDSVDIEDVINPPVRTELAYPMAELAEPSDNQARRVEKEEKHQIAIQNYNKEMRRRKAEDNAKFNGLRIGDIDKKLKSQLYLAFGREG